MNCELCGAESEHRYYGHPVCDECWEHGQVDEHELYLWAEEYVPKLEAVLSAARKVSESVDTSDGYVNLILLDCDALRALAQAAAEVE